MPMTPNIIQTANEIMNANVLANRTAYARGCCSPGIGPPGAV
jgi:hypothetical protein